MIKCLCGASNYELVSHPVYGVDVAGNTLLMVVDNKPEHHPVVLGKCTACGIIRQVELPFETPEAYAQFYREQYPPNNPEYQAKSREHDVNVARMRMKEYGPIGGAGSRVLDVGSGSGAFVAVCREQGMNSFGCEIGTYHYELPEATPHIYRDRFEDIGFPTDHFDLVTCHDVLEHSLDPVGMIREMFRTTKQDGRCVVDFPRFFVEAGSHHWKDAEHVWFFNEEQLAKLLTAAGFEIDDVKNPIESKVVFYCSKPAQERPTILVPPGIGDSYWSITKMEAFLKREKLGIPDVSIVSDRDRKHNGHSRSIPFLDMLPFLHVTDELVPNDPRSRDIWNEAYARQGRTIFKKVLDHDYFISYNGHLRVGKHMEDLDRDLHTNWYPKMFVSLEQTNFKKFCQEEYGRYVVCYFPFYGTYKHWTSQFPVDAVIETIRKIKKETGCTPIFTGARWDAENTELKYVMTNVPGCVNLTGKTSVAQLFGMIKGAEATIGYPSGLTIMSTVFKQKTFMVWNGYYNREFAWNCAPPDTRGTTYFIDFTENLTIERFSGKVKELIETGKVEKLSYPIGQPFYPAPVPRSVIAPEFPQAMLPTQGMVTTEAPKERIKLAVLCVLKSGGEYTEGYVQRLKGMIHRNTKMPYQFFCLTDVDIDPEICNTIPLKMNYPGWWSKIELFRRDLINADRIVYFDLDTVIVGNIDDVFTIKPDFAALGTWNDKERAAGVRRMDTLGSGFMMWKNHGEYSFLFDEFNMETTSRFKRGDQEYILNRLEHRGKKYGMLQDMVGGVFSYKRNCLSGLPNGAKIICFHGKPRPHEALSVKWVRTNWR